MDKDKIEKGFAMIIDGMGENVNREGLKSTPARVARMYEEIFSGIGKDPKLELNTMFHEKYDEIVVLKDIPMVSMCEHHFLPFTGKVSLGYIPNEKISGLSKLARVVEVLARKPQVQERLTNEIADTLFNTLEAKAVGVVIEAIHSCMTIRGIKKNRLCYGYQCHQGAISRRSGLKNGVFQVD